jgi:hypothetical protein
MDFTAPLGRGSRPRASTRYAHSDPRAAAAALGDGKIHGPSLGGWHNVSVLVLGPYQRSNF